MVMTRNTIKTRFPLFFHRLDSTNTYCMRNAAKLPHGTIVVADYQFAGRGQYGRNWYSPPCQNLYTSLLLKKEKEVDLLVAPTVLTVAVSTIIDTLAYYQVEATRLHLSNDVYVKNKKIAGILCDRRLKNRNVEVLIIGIGINLNMDLNLLAKIDQPATSVLLETGQRVSRNGLLFRLWSNFQNQYQQL